MQIAMEEVWRIQPQQPGSRCGWDGGKLCRSRRQCRIRRYSHVRCSRWSNVIWCKTIHLQEQARALRTVREKTRSGCFTDRGTQIGCAGGNANKTLGRRQEKQHRERDQTARMTYVTWLKTAWNRETWKNMEGECRSWKVVVAVVPSFRNTD